MSTSDRADLHRMATQIALSYARCHNETFDAFPALFQTAYHSLLSCSTQPLQREQAPPAKKAVAPPRPVAQPKRVAQGKPKPPARAAAAKTATTTASAQRKPASGTGWPTWTGSTNKPGRPPKNGAGSKNGAGRYR